MTIALGLLLSLGIGAGIRRWWALLLPASIGGVSAAAILLSGRGLGDTPIPFVVVASTVTVGLGILLPRRQSRRPADGR
jgi:hypothetical protein